MKKALLALLLTISTQAQALDLTGPGLTTVIIFPNDSVDTSAFVNAGLFQRYLCYMKFNLTDISLCSQVLVRRESANDGIYNLPTSIRIYVGRHSDKVSGYVNTQISSRLTSLTTEDSFLWAYNSNDRAFMVSGKEIGLANGTINGIFKILQDYASLILTLPAVNNSLPGISGLVGINDYVPVSPTTPLAIPDTHLNVASGALAFRINNPSLSQRLYSTNLFHRPGISALPLTYFITNLSSKNSGKRSITHAEGTILRPLTLPDGTSTPSDYNSVEGFYSVSPVPPLAAPNANTSWRPCYSYPGNELAQAMTSSLLFQHKMGFGLSLAINDSGPLCQSDKMLQACQNNSTTSPDVFPIELTTAQRESRSAACYYFNALRVIDNLLEIQNTQPTKPKINLLMHAYLKEFDPLWRFTLSTKFQSIYVASDEAQYWDPDQFQEQFDPTNSVIAKTSKMLPNQKIGIYNYLAEPGFLIPRYYPSALNTLVRGKYNQTKALHGMYSEFYPNPGNMTDSLMGYINSQLSWSTGNTSSTLITRYTNLVYGNVSPLIRTYLNNWELAWKKQFQLDVTTDPNYAKNQLIKSVISNSGMNTRSLYRWMNHTDQFLFVEPQFCAAQLAILNQASLQATANIIPKIEYQKRYLLPICDLANLYHAWRNGKHETANSQFDIAKFQTIFKQATLGTSAQTDANYANAYSSDVNLSPINTANKTMHDEMRKLRPWEGLSALSRKYSLNKTFATQADLNSDYNLAVRIPLQNGVSTELQEYINRVKPIVVEKIASEVAPNMDSSEIGSEWGAPQIDSQRFMNTDTTQIGLLRPYVSGSKTSFSNMSLYLKRLGPDVYVAIKVNSTSPVPFATLPAAGSPIAPLANDLSTALRAMSYKTSRQFLRVAFKRLLGASNGKPFEPQLDYIDINPTGHLSFNERGIRSDLIDARSWVVSGCYGASNCQWVTKFKVKSSPKMIRSLTQSYSYSPVLSAQGYKPNTDIFSGTEVNFILWNGTNLGLSLFPQGFEYFSNLHGTWLDFPNTERGFPVLFSL